MLVPIYSNTHTICKPTHSVVNFINAYVMVLKLMSGALSLAWIVSNNNMISYLFEMMVQVFLSMLWVGQTCWFAAISNKRMLNCGDMSSYPPLLCSWHKSQCPCGVWSKRPVGWTHTGGAKYASQCYFVSYSFRLFHALDILAYFCLC